MMDACLHDAAAVLERERSTLEWVRSQATKIHRLVDLANSAAQACYRFREREGMGVYLKWQVGREGNGRNRFWLHVGGLIRLRDEAIQNMSYYLCVTRHESGSTTQKVLRKYHFDYANAGIREKGRSSVFHLQYPGTLPPDMEEGYDDSHMDPWLETPRIFFMPMSLSLVLHLAFREFPDEYTNRLAENGDWQTVFVYRDQECLIVPFLQKCIAVATGDKKKLLWDVACEPE